MKFKKLTTTALLFLLGSSAYASVNTDNTHTMGKGASDKVQIFNRGAGSANPKILWNESLSKLGFKNNGVDFKAFGTGSGGSGGGINLLVTDDNAGFEEDTTGWTASGGSFTIDSATPLMGLKSGVFDASATSQTLSSALKAYDSQGKALSEQGNCLAAFAYKYSGTSGDYAAQVYDGTNVIATLSLDQASSTSEAYLGFSCPTSGSFRFRIISIVSNPGAITVDGSKLNGGFVQLGSNILLAQLANAEMFGGWNEIAATSCARNITASTGWDNFAADTDCATPTVTGKVTAHGTKVLGFDVATMPPGEYIVVFTGTLHDDAASQVHFALSDGVTRTGNFQTRSVTGSTAGVIVGHFSYSTTQTNKVFQVQCNSPVNATDCTVPNDVVGSMQNTFTVVKLPTVTQTVLQGIDASGLSWSGKITGCTGTNTVTSATYADFPSQTGCTMTDAVNNNFGSVSAAAVGFGPTWTPKKIGTYDVCAIFSMETSSTDFQARLVDGAGTLIIDLPPVSGVSEFYPVSLCGKYKATSLSAVTFKIQALSSVGTVTLRADSQFWSITDVTQSLPMPYLVKQLQSPSSAVMKHATAYISNSGSPTITRQDGAWLSSLTDNGTGDTTVNISGGEFSVTPNCQCTGYEETGDTFGVHCSVDKTTAPSTTALRIRTRQDTSLAEPLTDRDFSISCTGPQ